MTTDETDDFSEISDPSPNKWIRYQKNEVQLPKFGEVEVHEENEVVERSELNFNIPL